MLIRTRKQIVQLIHVKWSSLLKPEIYADLILEGNRIGAVNSQNAKKRSDFMKSGKVTSGVFNSSYKNKKRLLLEVIQDREFTTRIISARVGMVFGSDIENILRKERSELIDYISYTPAALNRAKQVLGSRNNATAGLVMHQMELGNIFKQVAKFMDVFDNLKRYGLSPPNCQRMSVITWPVFHYYLNFVAKAMLANVPPLKRSKRG